MRVKHYSNDSAEGVTSLLAEPQQRERSVRHGVRRGGAGGGGGLPSARAPLTPRAVAHRTLARQVRPARQLQRQGRGTCR